MELSVAELVAAVKLRDEDAYAELFRRMSKQVKVASSAVLGDVSDAEDVVADVFIEFWIHPESFDPTRASLLGFLRLKAKGRSIDILRSRRARVRREDQMGSEPKWVSPELEAGVIALESSRQVHAALAQLPPREREVIRLAFFNDMSYSEVAKLVGHPEGTVKSQIRSGLRRLAGCIEAQTRLSPTRATARHHN